MATNLGIDEKLLAQAQRLGGHKTKKAAVNEALANYVRRKARKGLLDLFGKIDYDPRFDYKRARNRRSSS
jgi:Arc/MetJ family transcription regulator